MLSNYSTQKYFLRPWRKSNPSPADRRWDALSIELYRRRWWPNQYLNVTFGHYLSCRTMVGESHRRSEIDGFDSCQGLGKFFWVG